MATEEYFLGKLARLKLHRRTAHHTPPRGNRSRHAHAQTQSCKHISRHRSAYLRVCVIDA